MKESKNTFVMVRVEVKNRLEEIKKANDLHSMGAVIKMLLEKCGGKI